MIDPNTVKFFAWIQKERPFTWVCWSGWDVPGRESEFVSIDKEPSHANEHGPEAEVSAQTDTGSEALLPPAWLNAQALQPIEAPDTSGSSPSSRPHLNYLAIGYLIAALASIALVYVWWGFFACPTVLAFLSGREVRLYGWRPKSRSV